MLPPVPFSQRWNEGLPCWQWVDNEPFVPRRYDVSVLTDDTTAKDFIIRHHYSRSYGAALFRGALWYGEELVGVFLLSVPSNNKVLTNRFPGLIPNAECMELGRFVLKDKVPYTGETWFLARCFEYARAAGVKGIVSFSDPVPRRNENGVLIMPGHIGTIYQAKGAKVLEKSTPRTELLLPNGQVLSDRSLQKVRAQEVGHEYVERFLVECGACVRKDGEDPRKWLREALQAMKVRRVRHPGKYCYGFLLDPKARSAMRLPEKPMAYPKRREPEQLFLF